MTTDLRQSAPAAERNKGPILSVLRTWLPESGLVLEIASGTGQHVIHFAGNLSRLEWQPSDPDPRSRQSIAAWIAETGLTNVYPPVALDATAPAWPLRRADALICLNMIHIAPWQATLGLMRGARAVLPEGGILYLYGPFRRGREHTAPSNDAFDRQLRERDPEWGVRDLDDVTESATAHGFALVRTVEMPANNLSVIYRRVDEAH